MKKYFFCWTVTLTQIEYCSTDAHDGSKASFRGDIEILAWCLIHWAAGELPWLKLVKENMTMADKEKVAQQKRDAVKSPKQFLAKLGLSGFGELEKLLSYRKKLEYEDEVDFDTCRGYFKSVLPKGNFSLLQKHRFQTCEKFLKTFFWKFLKENCENVFLISEILSIFCSWLKKN